LPPETVLAFDTSAAHCAAALLLPDGRCLTRNEAMTKGQAERLMPLLADLLAEAGLGWSALSRIGVGTGPGNFTGIRISVAAARGLAVGLGIPAIGVGQLEAMAHGLPRPLVVAEAARSGEIWVQAFTHTPSELVVLDDAGLRAAYDGWAATGSAAVATGGQVLAPAMPLAEATARIAATRLPGARPAPIYLRPADAAPPSDPPPLILP
jgi:tRNA threonylcarbamoyladenosine biosynthesis protein TsaB